MELDTRKSTLTASKRRAGQYELKVNGVPQSVVSMIEPTDLEYAYIRHIARAIDAAAPADSSLFTVHLGAGALTLARYVEATRPGSPQLVVEFEPALYAAVVTALPLAAGHQVRAIFGDARAVADAALPRDEEPAGAGAPPLGGDARAARPHARESDDTTSSIRTAGAADWVGAHFTVVDLWDAAVIHRRVASQEFYTRVAARSTADGVVAVNLLDGHPFDYSRRQAATLATVFEHIAVVLDAEPEDDEGPLGNVLVFASNRPLDIAAHPELLGEPLPHIVHGEALTTWIDAARPMTDADCVDSPDPDDPRWD
ncbi:MAG TPA: hypothetical protein VNJ54_03665 [Plantibacter sp.]|uniref:spermidine synthase n=1 Tax=unclassified Plantibacter TaxID=2624265 RepID=UPI002CA4752F|nr:hypothetical protein [Plantibacter sp.]